MTRKQAILIAFAIGVLCQCAAQEKSNGFRLTDPYGKQVFLIPACIAGKTVEATMSLKEVEESRAAQRGGVAGKFLVQVGAFAVPGNALRLTDRLQREGYAVSRADAYFERRKLAVQVVFVEGFGSRVEAEAALGQIESTHKLSGLGLQVEDPKLASSELPGSAMPSKKP